MSPYVINATVATIEGVIGTRSLEAANAALWARGEMAEIPAPDYGYLRGSLLLREKIDYDLCNDWVGSNLGELTYTDRHGGNGLGAAFICRLQSCACRYRMRYTRGVEVKEDMWGRLAELQIDKVAAQKDILKKAVRRGGY